MRIDANKEAAIELIALHEAVQVRFRATLIQDMFTTLALLQPAHRFEGLSMWIQRIAERVLPSMPAPMLKSTSALAFIPNLQGWLVNLAPDDHPAHTDIHALLAFLREIEPTLLGQVILEALRDRAIGCELPCPRHLTPEISVLLPLIEGIQQERERFNAPPLPFTSAEMADWLTDPAAFQQGLIHALHQLWEAGYGAHYAEDQQHWQQAITYHQQQAYQPDFAALFRAITGRPLPRRIEQQAERARRIEWIPSCHVGTYVVYSFYEGVMRLSFNAHLIPAREDKGHLIHLYPAFKALADETRLQILSLLANGQEYSVGDVADALSLSPSNVSRHLTLMSQTDLVQVRPQGTARFYRLNADGLRNITRQLHLFVEKPS